MKQVSNSVSFQADVIPGFKAGVVVDMDKFIAGFQVGMSFGTKTHTFTAGGEEYPGTLHDQSTINLRSIYDLSTIRFKKKMFAIELH